MADLFRRDYSTGFTEGAQAEFGRTIADMGSAIFSDVLQQKEAEEYSNAIGKWIDETSDFDNWQRENASHPELYIGELDRRRDKMLTNMLSDVTTPGAKRDITNKFNVDFPNLRKATEENADSQAKYNREVSFDINYDKLLKPPDKIMTESDIKQRLNSISLLIDENEGAVRRLTTETQADYEESAGHKAILSHYILQQALSMPQDEAVKYIEGANKLVKDLGYEAEFDGNEITKLKSEYEKEMKFQESIAKAELEAKEKKVAKQAMQLMIAGDLNGAKDFLKANLEAFDTDWFIDELNNVQNASRILADTGKNVYTDTQNWALYWEDKQKAIDGKLTEKEARSHVGIDGYSIGEYEKIVKSIDTPTSKDFEDSKAAKTLIDFINTITGVKEEQILILKEKGLRTLEDAIQSSEKPLKDRQKVEMAINIYNELNKEAENIEVSVAGLKNFPKVGSWILQTKNFRTENGKKILTREGLMTLARKFNGNKGAIIEYAKENGWVIP